ncbi:SHOCT domain-containing protein [Paractinoplanes globisporus]|uniref:SHOCT domain-containing protein n=1 Tax=Paractinoplanes globisporus TaxID=113565 RepID=A0ABW6WSC2_9ACTN|nr:SHOCT domain-containing protein [Actinoplanes globisporus]
MFPRPIIVRRGAPLLRGALVGGAGFLAGRAAARSADRNALQDAAIAEMQSQNAGPQYATPPQYAPLPPRYAPAQPQYAPPPAPPATSDDLASRLERLGSLHAEGVLTDEEFSAAKGRLLGT